MVTTRIFSLRSTMSPLVSVITFGPHKMGAAIVAGSREGSQIRTGRLQADVGENQ
jgi:hypothetical protein